MSDAGDWGRAIGGLAARLSDSFAEVLRWLEVDDDVWRARDEPEAWSVGQVLEHLVLTHHYLLILADKIAARSATRLNEGQRPGAQPSRFDQLEALTAKSVAWPAPEHMLPTGRATRSEVRAGLERDRARCLALLRANPAGQGSLHTIQFSPAGERLDLYQFLAVIELHLRRHLAQMQRARGAMG